MGDDKAVSSSMLEISAVWCATGSSSQLFFNRRCTVSSMCTSSGYKSCNTTIHALPWPGLALPARFVQMQYTDSTHGSTR